MAGIESFYSGKKKPLMKQIPVDASVKDAREAPDEDLDEFVRSEVLKFADGLLGKQGPTQSLSSHNPTQTYISSHEGTDGNIQFIVTSPVVTTNVYHISNATSPKEAIAQVFQWEAEGTAEEHRIESNTEHLTKQVIGIPIPDDTETVVLTNPTQKITLPKKGLSDKEANDIAQAFNNIIQNKPIDSND